ncbi:MAG: hypothetical protein GXY49_00175 [Syntrophomonadaceae bacterium]|nr:hypothetical protein [Syntrophomonadaceae bacterium]
MSKEKKLEFINDKLNSGVGFKEIYDAVIRDNESSKSREKLKNQFEQACVSTNPEYQQQEKMNASVTSPGSDNANQRQLNSHFDENIGMLIASAADILEMLAWWKNNREGAEHMDNRLNITLPGGEEVRKTIRINSQVWSEWKAFCGKHPDFNEKDLLAKALLSFINTEP